MTQSLTVMPQWEDEKLLETIRDTVAKGATPSQFRMFIEVCKATGLSPFLKEIYFVPSVGVMASRDGYLRKANEHPQFDGMETRVHRDEKNIPIKAVCTVWRKDRGHPVIAEAYYNEYKKAGQVWATYPSAMIAKVAEVLALKRSFAINGVVTEEEIGGSADERGDEDRRGSKEAQSAYLASKGLEPWQKENKSPVAHLEPRTVKAETVRELADMLDHPPQGTVAASLPGIENAKGLKTIEMRQAAKVAEADAALKEVKKPVASQRKTGAVTFDVLKHFGEIKKLIEEVTGTTELYYQTLKAYGYEKSNEIKDNDQAREIYKALASLHKRATEDNRLRTELEMAQSTYGKDRFMRVLGNNGCESIDDVLCLSSEPLEALRSEIKELGH